MMKDISRFKNRDIRRSVLLDPKPVNYIMTPENCMPVMEYTAEYASGKNGMTQFSRPVGCILLEQNAMNRDVLIIS